MRRACRFIAAIALVAVLLPATGSGPPAGQVGSRGRSLTRAIDTARMILASQRVSAGAMLSLLLDQQDSNVDAAGKLLELNARGGDPMLNAAAMAREMTAHQAQLLGVGLPAGPVWDPGDGPEVAALALLAQSGVDPSPTQKGELAALDSLPARPRSALAGVIEAFTVFDANSRQAFSGADKSALDQPVTRVEAGTPPPSPAAALAAAGVDVAALGRSLAARLELLDSIAALDRALAATPRFDLPVSMRAAAAVGGECQIPVAPVLCIDIGNGDNTYKADYALVVDVGGDDTYLNNGGGADSVVLRAAAALVDLGGDDVFGAADHPNSVGVNGGGSGGAGLLVDAGGTDRYSAGDRGTNGGGSLGTGMLIDVAGDDHYTSGGGATNGGAIQGSGMLLDLSGDDDYGASARTAGASNGGGGTSGVGALVDGGGDDSYAAMGSPANGGGAAGSGFLVDAAGDDAYTGTDGGVNGGAALGAGFLLDAGGDDAYRAGRFGANGAGSSVLGVPGSGLLLDAGGDDVYEDGETPPGTGRNKSVVPKGEVGAQVDIGSGIVVSVGDATVAEGDSGTSDMVFTVSLDAPSPAGTSVQYATADGTAEAASDYTAASGTVTIPAGRQTTTVAVKVNGDVTPEADETFFLKLTGADHAAVGDGQGRGTIISDEGVAAADTQVFENDAGTTDALFSVTVSPPSDRTVTLHYTTADETATVGVDYLARSGTLTFAPGQTMATVAVPVVGDTDDETDETFALELSSPVNTAIRRPKAIAVIRDDDGTGGIRVGDTKAVEGGSAVFTVIDDAPGDYNAPDPVIVDYETADGTATADADYEPARGRVRLSQDESTSQLRATITVPVRADDVVEADEAFVLSLSMSDAPRPNMFVDAQGRATVVDETRPAIRIVGPRVDEGDDGTTPARFTVTLAKPSPSPVVADYATEDGSATVADGDYEAASGTLRFLPGETAKEVTIAVRGDTALEGNEDFAVVLSGIAGAVVADQGADRGQATIVDDEAGLSVDDVVVTEGNDASFTVTLSKAQTTEVSMSFSTEPGTATLSDYRNLGSTSVLFRPGETSRQVLVHTYADTEEEPDETFSVRLRDPKPVGAATLARAVGTATIVDPPSISIDDPVVTEGDSGTAPATFTISLSKAATVPVTVHYETGEDSATAPEDFTATSGTLRFEPGETRATVTALVNGDTLDEPDERFVLVLTQPTNAKLAVPCPGAGRCDPRSSTTNAADRGTATILDDDSPSAAHLVHDIAAGVIPGQGAATGGGIFVSGHDADYHSSLQQEIPPSAPPGARRIVQHAVGYVTSAKPGPRLLYVSRSEGLATDRGEIGMAEAGFPRCAAPWPQPPATSPGVFGCFDMANAGAEESHVCSDCVTENLADANLYHYDAVVVEGTVADGDIDGRDLALLVGHAGQILDYVRAGHGLVVFSQRGFGERGYSFLPCLQQGQYGDTELTEGNGFGTTVTPEGRAMGLTEADFPLNITHNWFTTRCGYDVIDRDSQGHMVSLATRLGPYPGTAGTTDATAGITDATAKEGDRGLTPMTFTVSLGAAADKESSVDYTVKEGTAVDGTDYLTTTPAGRQITTGTLFFAPGETTKTIEVQVVGDTVDESDEDLYVVLANPVNVGLTRTRATGTIIDDDATPASPGGDPGNGEGGPGNNDNGNPPGQPTDQAGLQPGPGNPVPAQQPSAQPGQAQQPAAQPTQAQAQAQASQAQAQQQAQTQQQTQTQVQQQVQTQTQLQQQANAAPHLQPQGHLHPQPGVMAEPSGVPGGETARGRNEGRRGTYLAVATEHGAPGGPRALTWGVALVVFLAALARPRPGPTPAQAVSPRPVYRRPRRPIHRPPL